jgi:SARP family transcriptional regulator, regulator of embCAB operon
MSKMELKILGSVQPVIDDNEVSLPGRKLRCILAVLALRPGGEVRRDELIEELNLLNSTANAINALHAHMTRLRRWLQGQGGDAIGVLESTPSGYRLCLSPAAIDANIFVQQVEHAMKLGAAAPSVVATILEEALDLWRGDALIDVADGPLTSAAAAELHRIRTTARELLLSSWMLLGHDHRIIVHARRFIVDDPLNEQMRAQLITALRHLGRFTEAVEVYQTTERVLHSELGVGPGAGLRAAFVDTLHRSDSWNPESDKPAESPLYSSEF